MPFDTCRSCGKPIETFHAKVHAVRGYEETAGGSTRMLRKQRLDGYVWHKTCWERLVHRRDGTGPQLEMESGA
jgi:hypothetical protein